MMKASTHKPRILFMGKLPPPYIGPATATQLVLASRLKDEFQLIHLDLSDHREANTLARWDLTNIYLALKHYLLLIGMIIRYNPAAVYIPAGQTTVGYLRDAVFIIIAKLFRRKVICHLRGGNFLNWYQHSPGIVKQIVKSVHQHVDTQIVLSDRLRPLFNWIIPEDRIICVPNGLNLPEIRKSEKSGPLIVLYLSNFIRSKGVMEVLQAAAQFNDRKEEIRFILAGAYSEKDTEDEIHQFLAEHPELAVEVAGTLSGKEKEVVLRKADIFVLPSYYPNEGLPWSIIEAMACSLSIISTRHAAIPDCIQEGVNGFFVEKASVESLVSSLEKFIAEPNLAHRMGQESRRIYAQNFTEAHFIDGLITAFNKTLNR